MPKQAQLRTKKMIALALDVESRKQLDLLKIELARPSLQNMFNEALNDFFVKHGKKPIVGSK